MKWPRASFMLLIAVFGILLLDIELATGIKCYVCKSCGREIGEEKECESEVFSGIIIPGLPGTLPPRTVEYDRCQKGEYKEGSKIQKSCANQEAEDISNNQGFKCDDFGDKILKACFCTTDLCNKAPNIIRSSRRVALLTLIAFISTYSIVNLFI